ncbi:MAG: hypothetical protein ACREPP_01260 [Rhodanobacteraceae bacterium]
MKIWNSLICAFLLCACAGIGACSRPAGSTTQGDHSLLADTVADAIDKAREKLRTANLDVSSGNIRFSSGRTGNWTRAEISPQGDLLVGGKPVAVTPQQRALLLEYRARLIDVAEQGMQIGTQGVDLASHAVGTALNAVFSGKSHQQVNDELEAEAAGIRRSAAKLCERLPDMMAAQRKLAGALPAFRPYATMTEADIDHCRSEASRKDGAHFSMSY